MRTTARFTPITIWPLTNVQAALQELGYYHGPIKGYMNSVTRAAIANYQRDRGLYATSAINEPTLVAL